MTHGTGGQRIGETLGTPLRHRESHVLTQHAHEPTESAAASGVRDDVGVKGVAGQ
jgi:hypothetical protein